MMADNNLQLRGLENSNIRVALDSLSERSWHVELNVFLKECPPGFFFGEPKYECLCTDLYYGDKILCSYKSFMAEIRNGYWIGRTENGVELSVCPPPYCHASQDDKTHYALPQNYFNLTETICGGSKNRRGILCGLCKENYGVAVTTDTLACIPCNDSQVVLNIVKYFFVAYFPLIILIGLFLIFKVRVSTGSLNSFIFYIQTVPIILSLTPYGYPYANTSQWNELLFWKTYEVVSGFFNLRVVEYIFYPICIRSTLNALDVFQLDYIVALFPLILLILILMFINVHKLPGVKVIHRKCQQRFFLFEHLRKLNPSKHLLHVLVLYLHLSYTRLTLPSFLTLESNKPFDFHYHHTPRVFYAGHYLMSDMEYRRRYMTPAYLVLLTASVLPLILFKYPINWLESFIKRIKCLSRVYPARKIQAFLDVFQGCYRDDRKYFAGIYFLFRLFMGAVLVLTKQLLDGLLCQMVLCISLILIVGILRPYGKESGHLNIIDILMFTNLVIVSGLGVYMTMHLMCSMIQRASPLAIYCTFKFSLFIFR